MTKAPSPNADRLREQREERYGHLQATAEPVPDRHLSKNGRVLDGATPAPKPRKLIPFAGKETKGIMPKPPPRKRKAKP